MASTGRVTRERRGVILNDLLMDGTVTGGGPLVVVISRVVIYAG